MKKFTIEEEIRRFHEITFGDKSTLNENLLDRVRNLFNENKVDDPKRADFVTDDVANFFKTLETASNSDGLKQGEKGGMNFQKEVEAMQIGLKLLDPSVLPKHGIDGLFGPETAAAVKSFVEKNMGEKKPINEVQISSPIGDTSVNSPYGPRWGRQHHGVDLKADSGTQIKSPLDGEVIDAEIRANACGGTIYIQHADGIKSRYCHCKQINVKKGQLVKKGEIIGLTGGGQGEPGKGRSGGPHLHFELYKDGRTVDPMQYLGSEVGEFTGTGSNVYYNASPEMLKKLLELLKTRGVKQEELKQLIDSSTKGMSGGIKISLEGNWVDISKQLLMKYEGFSPTAKWDENAYRGGYGTDKIMKDGKIQKADANTTWTQQEALDTLDYEIKNTYAPIVAQQLGSENWEKLNDKQKASLVSLGYNVGPYFVNSRDYGKRIKDAISNNNMEDASAAIASGPTTGAGSGKFYPQLAKRREEESQIFLA